MTIDFEPDAEASLPGIDFEPDAPDAVKPASKPKAPSADPIAAIKAAQGLAQMHDFEASGFPSRLAFENDESSRLSRMREFSRAQKQSGLSGEDLRTGMADAAALNFNRRFDNEGKPMRDDARVLSFGEVAANPQLSFDEGAWKSAIESTNASPEAKQRAIADRLKYRDDLGEHLYQAALSSGTFMDWLDAQKDSEKASAGELIERFRKEKGAVSKGFMQAGSGIEAGVAGLGKGFYGLGEFIGVSDLSDAIGITDPKNPSLATIAAENEKRASGISEALGGATFLNKVARGGVSLAPMVLAGGAASALGASEAGALNAGIAAQAGTTAGGTFVDAKQAGLGPIESRLHGVYQAGVEAAFTKIGGATGAEALLSQKAGAAGIKNFAKKFAEGAARETFFEELPTTALQAPSAASINPNYNLADALFDTATVAAVLGGAMEGASGVSRANAAKALIAQAQEVGPATQAAVEAMRPRRAPEQNAAVAKPIVSESTKLRLTPKPEEQIYAPTNRDIQPSQTPSIPPAESVPSLPQAKEPVRLPSAESGLESAGEIDFEADVFEGVKPKPTKPEPYVEVYMPPINQFEIDSPADTFGDEGTLSGAVMDFGGIMSKSNGIKYGKVASQWDDQFVPARLSHRKVFGAGKAAKGKALVENTEKRFLAGLAPSEMVDELIRANKLPVGATVNDLWAALQEESDSAARVQGQASAEVRNAKDSIREARKQAVDFKDAAMQKDGDPIRIRELSINDTIKIADEPLKVIAIDPDTGDVTLEDGKRFGIQEVSERSIVYGEIVETGDASVDDIWADENETTPQQQGDDAVQAGETPESAAETGAQAEGAVPSKVENLAERARAWAKTLKSEEAQILSRDPSSETPNEIPFVEGELLADQYGENPYIYESRMVSVDDLKSREAYKLEGMTFEQVAQMPSTQKYVEWYRNGFFGPPITLVKKTNKEHEGQHFSTNRRRVVAAIIAGVDKIPAHVEIGRAQDIYQQRSEQIQENREAIQSDAPIEAAPAEAPKAPVPKLRAGQTQGDLLAGTTEDAFNLAGETAIDGERVAREKAEKEKREAELQADFERRQTNLFDAPKPEATKPDIAASGLPIGPGKMTAGELPEQTKIGSYNAMVDKQRAERGLPPLMSEARKLDETTWDNAERAIEADETLPERLVDDILSGRKMQATDEDQAVLLWRMIDLRNRREQAGIRMNDSSLSIDEQNAQMNEFSFLEAQLQETESADRKIGTAQGRALRFRRVLANEDFTLAGIEAGLRRAKAEPLTPDELAGAKQDAEKIADIQKMAGEKEDAADEQQSIEAAKALIAEAARYSPEVLRYAEKVVSKWEAEAAAAEQVLREAMGFANAGVNPKVIGAIFKIARAKLARKALSLADFTAEMVSKFGDGITAAVGPAYERAVKFITGLDASKVRKKSKKQLDRESAAGDQADATEAGIREVASKGTKFSELSAEVKRLAREYIESGVDTVEKLEDRLYAFFNPLFPEITKRQLRDAFSDYGKSTPAPTDPLRVTASRLRTEAQKLSQLESLMAKQAPLRTGQQRNPQSDRARALQREINELKRRMELTEGRTADQLRTILDSMITRTTNRIKDLRFEIARGERLIRTKTAPPTSMKLEALREELAKVEAEHASMFPRAQMTEEQKLKVAIAAAERANKVASAELENAKKGIFSKPAEKGVTRSAELDAIRQKTKAARLELAALKDAANPRNPELEAAQDALNKALVSKERWDQVLKGELVVPGKKPGEALSDFEDDVRAEIAAMRQLAAEIKRDSRPKTDPQIAKENAQVKALEKAAADYEARLNAGDFSKKGRVNGPDTERVAAAKALRDAAKKAYDAAVEAATPKLSPEQIKINVRKAQIQRQLAEIADREARGDYAKRAKKPKLDLSSDPEAVKLQAQLEKAKSDLARKMFEYEQARRTRGQKIKDAIFETLRSERNLLGSMDVSAPRQGLGLILAHPVIGAKKLTKMFSALFSEKQALEMEAARNLRPNAQAGIYKRMKLALTPLGDTTFTAAEENARSSVEKWADFDLGKGNVLVRAAKVPLKLIGKGVRISNRAYVTYLNELRADVADALLRINFHSAAPSDADLEAVGSMINTFSGRGLERGAGQFASNILYSPQFLMARIKMLIGFHAWRPNSTADARKIAAKEHVRQLGTWFVIMSLINALSDEKDEKDEGLASSDTGKFVDGNTRIDYSGGSASLFVLGARLWNNVAASVSRNFSDDDKGAKKQAWDFPQEFYRQYRYKAAPWIGTILDWASGKPPLSSEPVTVADSARRLVMPMSWDGVSGLMEEHGIAKGAFYQMQNLLGAGVKNYESKR